MVFILIWTREGFRCRTIDLSTRFGWGKCKAVIWANPTEQGTRYNVTFQRLYKKDEQWETTSSFGRDDPPFALVARRPGTHLIYEKQASERETAANDDPRPMTVVRPVPSDRQ